MADIVNDMSPEAAAQALSWLVAMGADEIISDVAMDRFAASAVKAVTAESIRPAPLLQPAAQAPAVPPSQVAADARNLAASANSLQELKQALTFFNDHPLRKGSTKLSFLEGPETAGILLIGDKPRNDEDKSGQVFAGKARELLRRMLAAIDLSLDDVALMNFIPYRPPGNRAPNDIEIASSHPFALRVIEILKPRFILGFGPLAGQSLAGGESSILKQRGRFLKIGDADFVSTLHPDELLKFPQHKKLAWRDLLAFKQKVIS
ncbi:MAG: uracil-DNA glycosylase [Aestuariivirga sp.]